MENAPSHQRYSEESDLLERSTRKRKVADGSSVADPQSPAGTTASGSSTPEGVEFVAETPLEEDPALAMQVEDASATPHLPEAASDSGSRPSGGESAAVPDSGTTPLGQIGNAPPRSYLDSVVGSGSGAAPFLISSLPDEDDVNSMGDDDLETEEDDPTCPRIRPNEAEGETSAGVAGDEQAAAMPPHGNQPARNTAATAAPRQVLINFYGNGEKVEPICGLSQPASTLRVPSYSRHSLVPGGIRDDGVQISFLYEIEFHGDESACGLRAQVEAVYLLSIPLFSKLNWGWKRTEWSRIHVRTEKREQMCDWRTVEIRQRSIIAQHGLKQAWYTYLCSIGIIVKKPWLSGANFKGSALWGPSDNGRRGVRRDNHSERRHNSRVLGEFFTFPCVLPGNRPSTVFFLSESKITLAIYKTFNFNHPYGLELDVPFTWGLPIESVRGERQYLTTDYQPGVLATGQGGAQNASGEVPVPLPTCFASRDVKGSGARMKTRPCRGCALGPDTPSRGKIVPAETSSSGVGSKALKRRVSCPSPMFLSGKSATVQRWLISRRESGNSGRAPPSAGRKGLCAAILCASLGNTCTELQVELASGKEEDACEVGSEVLNCQDMLYVLARERQSHKTWISCNLPLRMLGGSEVH
nr:hypothetical protein Iba_chr06dCG1040 [Ipomoea batatas]